MHASSPQSVLQGLWTTDLARWRLLAGSGAGCHDGKVIEVTEPQVWTLIGVFAAALFGMVGLMSTWFMHVLRAEIGGVRAEIGRLRGEMSAEIGGLRGEMNGRFEAMDARFDALAGKVEHLDRDVQTLFRRQFPDYPDAD